MATVALPDVVAFDLSIAAQGNRQAAAEAPA
jgi:hypothetical protein